LQVDFFTQCCSGTGESGKGQACIVFIKQSIQGSAACVQAFLGFVAVWFVVIVFIEHFRAQFFSTTDAGPEHELEVQVLIQNLKPSSLLSVGWADIGCCKVKVKQAASI